MSDTQAALFAALAALQAELPHIDKSNVGDIPGKEGKRGYKYKYADLADVSQAILPLLAKHGLAFNSKPTVVDGEFGLSYKLVHKSGEKDEGFVPFGRNGTPQQMGSLITYYRRYCLCAVTGAAPDEDDDASAAEQPYRQSAADAFEQAAPARQQQQRPQAVPLVTAESDANWLDLIGKDIDKIRTRQDGVKVWSQIAAAFNDGTCSPQDRKALEAMTAAKISAIKSEEDAA